MKTLQDWAAVQRLFQAGKGKLTIAKELGISRNTVKRLLKMDQEPKYNRDKYYSKIDPFKEQIVKWRCAPYDFNGTRIFRELKSRGYSGSIGPLYRYLRKLDEDITSISSKATVRIETPVGDQAQFDWSEYEVPVAGVIKTVYCFGLVMAASRQKAICFSLKSDADAIYTSVQDLFHKIGGVTLELLIDNPKALVLENNPRTEDEVKYNPHAMLLAKHLGCELNACPCYWPRKKGKIENPFKYIEEQFIRGNSFSSMEELNARGNAFMEEWNNTVHHTTKRVPNEFFLKEEAQTLLPLPDRFFYKDEEYKVRKVSNECMVSFNGCKYSVPAQYALKEVLVRIEYGFRIKIFSKKKEFITSHEISSHKGSKTIMPEHLEAISPRTSTSIPQIRRDFTAVFPHGMAYLEKAEHSSDIQQPVHHARKILELRETYSDETLDYFLEYAIATDSMDIKSFKKLLKEFSIKFTLPEIPNVSNSDHSLSNNSTVSGIIRNMDYYEQAGKEIASRESSGC